MQVVPTEMIDAVVDLAVNSLPLDELATGAADSLGLGAEYRFHHCLEAVVQYLGGHPGKGWPLIAACLKSPVVRNRSVAVGTLAAWGRDSWTEDMEHALLQARRVEPNRDAKDWIKQTLAGEPEAP
jgi:hypothetical protein